ncbi:MAG TPA: T9SS type A sorting domain-containing protein [Candidatus Kapabacteria bacterium]|nr:T9SS type A sorting domain-containing protein [Candidatus Kapabacteria bacterium]
MKHSILFVVAFFICSALKADDNVLIYFKVNNTATPNKFFNLGVGINEMAGDSVDTALGEHSLPPFPPTFYAALEYVDSSKYNSDGSKFYDLIHTDLDLRSIPADKEVWQNRHKLLINWSGAKGVDISWNINSIPKNVDSIFLRDIMGGIVINEDLRKSTKITLSNDAIDKLYIDIYYKKEATSVDDDKISDITVYPNPFVDNIKLSQNLVFNSYEIYNINGDKLVSKQQSNIDNLKTLSIGVYLLILKKDNAIIGKAIINKI